MREGVKMDDAMVVIFPGWFLYFLVFMAGISAVNIGLDIYKAILDAKIKKLKD